MPAEVVSIFEVRDYEAELHRGVELLNRGGIVVLPTETVYGAAGLLTHPEARARMQTLRGAAETNPFTIHLGHPDDALDYLGEVSDLGRRLMRKLWPGPVGLTFEVSAERRREACERFMLSELDLYENGTITLRCPDHVVTTEIIDQVKGPVGLTIAGASTGSHPRMQELSVELDGQVDLIYDAGPTRYSKPSTLLKVNENSYEIVRAGVYDERIIERLLRTTILFVCSGNTCRSPMAEAIARNVLAKKLNVSETELDRKGIRVISAGSFAMPGARATPQAVDALRDVGIDLSRHRSQPLSVELIHQADAIYTMGRSHLYAVQNMVPSAAEKAMTLNPDGDIEDPIGSDLHVYQELTGQLQTLIEQRLEEHPVA